MSNKTDAEWRATLSPEEYDVLRNKGTERPYSGKYLSNTDHGIYECRGCGNPLYPSSTKFQSCGWPSYADSIPGAIKTNKDYSHGMVRTEATCAKCGSHLGHIFEGEVNSGSPTGVRHCINSIALDFKPKKEA
ncbi:uncharacterized protein KGF55_004100 [Candida pseudojiufengensis]|uniref:uncharacterized protein n=1 Tax=Candida pseudojiufengensis TaxID=497109 RepID=UPI002224976A|nr:uncharacterized protein KGF55_004100 [Candida pseudojiufengensis]KAI5961175.1 hypothetical protein KGF55_004100 [Candida pseudojiufengensis]